jgi:16S rRNA pseudouridine516 synthase
MRLDQFISQTTTLSRKQAKIAIKKQQVMVNGKACKEQNLKVSENDVISLNTKTLSFPKELYFMLHKPAGYCCSHEDDGYPSALKLLPETPKKLHFAGRLDADTTGLVLLSSDGKWCHRITSPKQKTLKAKAYQVHVAELVDEQGLEQLRQGVQLKGEAKATLAAQSEKISDHCYQLTLQEGKYHQVKRMFAAIGNKVTALHRQSIGSISLDASLQPGEYRALTASEVNSFNE